MSLEDYSGITALCKALAISESDYRYAKSTKGRIYIETSFRDEKSGKARQLCYPPQDSTIRLVQDRIKTAILAELPLLREVRAYRPKSHNINAASTVCGSRYAGKVDISKFHPSITPKHVSWALSEHGLSPSWAREISEIVTYKGCVPQGAPTSNHIANLVMDSVLRREIKAFANSRGVAFVNFGDDVAFFGDNAAAVKAVTRFAKRAISSFGFETNEKCRECEHRGTGRSFIGCATGRQTPDLSRAQYRKFRSEIRALVEAERTRSSNAPLTSRSDLNSIKHRIAYVKRLNTHKARRLLDEFYRLCEARRTNPGAANKTEPLLLGPC